MNISNLFNFLPKNKIFRFTLYLILLLIVLLVIYFSLFRNGSSGDVVVVKMGEVRSVVMATGKTEAVDNVNLSFDQTGRISSTPVRVGDTVVAGQVLAEEDQSSAYGSVMQAEGAVKSAQAKLDQLKKGARSEDLAVYFSKLLSAERSLTDTIKDSFAKVDDAIRNKIDRFYNGPNGPTPIFGVYLNNSGTPLAFGENLDPQTKLNLSNGRLDVGRRLTAWQADLSPSATTLDLQALAQKSKDNIAVAVNLVDSISLAVNAFASADSSSKTVTDAYKADVLAARSAISLADSNLTSAAFAVDLALKQYNLAKASATKEDLAMQEALVEQAEGQLASARSAQAKMVITAPFDGLVTKQDAKVGEIASAGVPLVSMISPNRLQIETNIAEVDVGKLVAGNPVKITLDALPDELFEGKVIYVDPAGTTIDGIVYYKTKVTFSQFNEKLKAGLTANLEIITAQKSNVLIVPQYAVATNGGVSSVKKLVNGRAVNTTVKVGLQGSEGLWEIVSGLKLGDKILNTN